MYPSRSSESNISLGQHPNGSKIGTPSLQRVRTVETRPQSDIIGESSSLYTSHHFEFSQFCLKDIDNYSKFPSELAYVSASTYPTHPRDLHNTASQDSVVRVIGSQPVRGLRDDRKVVRRSTISTIARKLAEQKDEWMKDEETEGDNEELVKQREHRAKAGRVLALLELEQKALETEEQEEKQLWEQCGRQEEEQESSRRASTQFESPAIEMDEHEESEHDNDEGHRKTVSSENWAWAQLQNTISCYRSDMLALVTKFEEANRRVWREVIHRHISSSGSPTRDPLAPLVNNQMRGGAHDIRQLKSKRQHKLKECTKVQRQWHSIQAAKK